MWQTNLEREKKSKKGLKCEEEGSTYGLQFLFATPMILPVTCFSP